MLPAHGDEVVHRGVVALLHISAKKLPALGKPDGVKAVLEIRVVLELHAAQKERRNRRRRKSQSKGKKREL